MSGFAALNDPDRAYSEESVVEEEESAYEESALSSPPPSPGRKGGAQGGAQGGGQRAEEEEDGTEERKNYAQFDVTRIARPFKNPAYTPPHRRNKTIKQVLLDEGRRGVVAALDRPTYTNVDAPPSLLPMRKWCDITGLRGVYHEPRTGLRYRDMEVYAFIKSLPHGVDAQYLFLRRAAAQV